jgi:hypothetical protein
MLKNFILLYIFLILGAKLLFAQSEIMEKKYWLWNLEKRNTNESFIRELDIQLKPQFEVLLGKKLNWDRVWLFMDFANYNPALVRDHKDSMRLDNVQLVFRASRISASLSWHSVNGDELITVYQPIKPGEVIFDLKILDDSLKYDFPTPDDPFIKTKFDVGVDFPVFISTDFLTDDVYIYFDLEDESEMDKLEKSICDFVELWNDSDIILSGRFPEKKVENQSFEFGGQVFTPYVTSINILTENIDFWRYLILYLSEEVKGIKSFVIGKK